MNRMDSPHDIVDDDDDDDDDDLVTYLLSLESTFHANGFTEGTLHGELHGLFAGRNLGREKGWELWEEVGYYEGVARFWKEVLVREGTRRRGEGRAVIALDQVLAFVNAFPTINDSSLAAAAAPLTSTTATSNDDENENENEKLKSVDMISLLNLIRSKYRAAVASLGVRPRIIVAGLSSKQEEGGGVGGVGVTTRAELKSASLVL